VQHSFVGRSAVAFKLAPSVINKATVALLAFSNSTPVGALATLNTADGLWEFCRQFKSPSGFGVDLLTDLQSPFRF
jgi:hypothetical protein